MFYVLFLLVRTTTLVGILSCAHNQYSCSFGETFVTKENKALVKQMNSENTKTSDMFNFIYHKHLMHECSWTPLEIKFFKWKPYFLILLWFYVGSTRVVYLPETSVDVSGKLLQLLLIDVQDNGLAAHTVNSLYGPQRYRRGKPRVICLVLTWNQYTGNVT